MHTLLRLRQALHDKDIGLLKDAYIDLPNDIDLGSDDVVAMTQVLSHTVSTSLHANQNAPKEWTEFADLLVQDLRSNSLAASPNTGYNLLQFYDATRQFDRGAQFWAWLIQQDDTYNSPNTYAAAIQLLAKQGRLAHETEGLFTQALQRFPSSFAEYHLSPNAVLQDRGQPSMAHDVPMTLLSAIITARLLQGDSKDAYLGLDTAFRISPERLPLSFYASFIEERPLTEAYKVFQLAAQSGTYSHKTTTRTLLNKLRSAAAAAAEPLKCASIIRATLTVVTQNVKLGDTVVGAPAFTEIIIAILSVLDIKTWSNLSSQQLRPLTDRLDAITASLIDSFRVLDVHPTIAAYNTMINNLAGRGKRSDILFRLLQDIETQGLKPTIVTHRSVMRAAAQVGDAELHTTAWNSLVQSHEAAGNQPRRPDWSLLASTAAPTGNVLFAREQVGVLSHTLAAGASVYVLRELDSREKNFRPSVESKLSSSQTHELEIATRVLDQIRADVEILSAVVRDENFAGLLMDQIPLDLGQPQSRITTDDESARLKAVYDEMTLDSSSQSFGNEQVSQPAISAGGVSYDELRLRNWLIMNELMAEAEIYDVAHHKTINFAINAGRVPPARDDTWLKTSMSLIPDLSVGLSDYVNRLSGPSALEQASEPPWLATSMKAEDISRLRGEESK